MYACAVVGLYMYTLMYREIISCFIPKSDCSQTIYNLLLLQQLEIFIRSLLQLVFKFQQPANQINQ